MIFLKRKTLLVLPLFFSLSCFAQLEEDFNRAALDAGNILWNQGFSSGMTGEFLIESNELRAVFDDGSGTRQAYISTEIQPDLLTYVIQWKGSIKLDFSNLSSSLVSKNLCRYYLMSDKENLSDNPNGYFLEFKLVPTEDSLTCKLFFESEEGKTELPKENSSLKFKAQEFLIFEVSRNPEGEWNFWLNDQFVGMTNFPALEPVHSTGLQINYSSGAREDKYFMDDLSLVPHPFIDSISVISPNELELFCKTPLDAASISDLDNYTLNDSINTTFVSFDSPDKIKLEFSEAFIPDYLNTLSINGITDTSGYEIPEERPQNLNFTYSQPDLSPPEIVEITGIEKNQIFVSFNEPVVFDSAVLNFLEIENQVIDYHVDSIDNKKLKLTFQEEFKVGDNYTLKVRQIADLEGNVQNGQEFNFVFEDNLPPGLEAIEVLSGKSLKLIFSEALGEFQTSLETNYWELVSGLQPELALLNNENPSEVFLYFNQEFEANEILEIRVSNLEDNYGNRIENSVSKNYIYDTKKPSINTTGSIIPINDKHLELHFTEPVSLSSAAIPNNYEVKENIGFPSFATRDSADFSVVHLYFDNPFMQENEYEITIRNVSDLAGNVISTKTRAFIVDQKPPELLDLRIFSKKHLKLFFSEPVSTNTITQLDHFWINYGVGNPDSIFVSPFNTKVAQLFFENDLPEQDSILLVISDLEDNFENVLPQPDSVFFNTKMPSVSELVVVSEKTLKLYFSEKIEVEKISVERNLVEVNLDSFYYQNTDSSVLWIELSAALEVDSSNTLKLENVIDFSGNVNHSITENFVFHPMVEEVKVVAPNVLNLHFEEELHPDFQFENTDFSIVEYAINPLSVILDFENHHLLTLVFQENFPSDTALKLKIPALLEKNGEMAPGTNIDFIYDQIPPKVASVEAVKNELFVSFTEPVEKVSATALNHYLVDKGIGNPVDFEFKNDTSVLVLFENNFEEKKSYFLTIEKVKDLADNTILDTAVQFKVYPNPKQNQVIITEIMADPSPSIGLPDAEFLEIWNVTQDTFNLAGMKLVDGTGETFFPNHLIYPNDYLILCGSSNYQHFKPFGKTLSLTSYPSLNNSGETLSLQTSDNEVVNEVNYAGDWYGNDEKADGGWSLEIIDPFNFCSEEGNWKASENTLGGTPGQINSVIISNPDTIAPKLNHWEILNDSTLKLIFSEKMDTASMVNYGNFILSEEMNFDFIYSADAKSLELTFSSRLKKGKNYQLTVLQLADNCGNLIQDSSLNFILPEIPHYNEIIVTEIFADPNPSVGLPEFEYFELYNASDKTFDLGDLKLEIGEDHLKINHSLLQPYEYMVLTSTTGQNSLEKFGRAVGVTNWIALKNSGDQIILRNKKGELIFEITYQDDWYSDIEKEDGGYSLEMKNVNKPCLGSENWEASQSEIGGTPSRENSWEVPQIMDNFPPKLLRGYVNDELNIQLIFDGKLDSLSAVNAVLKIEPEIRVKQEVFDYHNPTEISLKLENPLEEKVGYEVSVKDIQDCSGNTNIEWQTLKLVLPEQADSSDILISEVLFNPPVGGIDFVEIYNKSDKHINLKNWKIGNGKSEVIISESALVVVPNTFLTLSSDINQLKTQHLKGADSTFFEVKLPSFSDKEGVVILKNNFGNIIDELSYHEDFHNPDLDDKDGVSLERINYNQPSNKTDNWTSAAETEGSATPGYKNSQYNDHQFSVSEECFEVHPNVIVPDLDGIDDYAVLNYSCLTAGSLATIIIYDAFGREIKRMINNQIIPVDGQFVWDGTDSNGQRVNMGNYIFRISLIEGNGATRNIKKNVAVGTKF